MELIEQTKILIKQIGLKPDKLKGQNFCIDQKVIDQMIKAAELKADDIVLEVGPGFGFLTSALCQSAGRVIAVELEPELASITSRLKKFHHNLEVIQGNILKLEPEKIFKNRNASQPVAYKIVANLPYSITSVFIKKFLTVINQPQSLTLLLQKEVAERICAKAGQLSLLAISVQLYAQPQIAVQVKNECFWPQPKVGSAILKINNLHHYTENTKVTEKMLWQVVKSGFSSKRKQLHNNLANGLHLTKEQISLIFKKSALQPQVRAQQLSIEDWLKIAEIYHQSGF
jgi:16S rRNA (adenine1518-N6/adenine1519-N6)-dimethyltransferase